MPSVSDAAPLRVTDTSRRTRLSDSATYRVIGPRVRKPRSPLVRRYRRNERAILGIAGLVSFFGLWQIGSMIGFIDPLSGPSRPATIRSGHRGRHRRGPGPALLGRRPVQRH